MKPAFAVLRATSIAVNELPQISSTSRSAQFGLARV
jgi:hypothetical protein